MKHPGSLLVAGLLLLTASLLVGCSSDFDYGPTGTVSGRLTMNGKPLKAGTQVVFMHPEKGYAAFGSTDPEGKFQITSWNDGNLPVGPYRVMIQPPAGEINPDTATPEQLLDNPELAEAVPEAEFPFKYRQTSTSGLSYNVEQGPNTFEIDLEADGRRR